MFSLHKISVSLIFFFLCPSVPGSDPFRVTAGAAESGISCACIMKPGFWSSFHNQALLALFPATSAGIDYRNRFGIAELGTRSAGIIIRHGNAGLGAVYSNFGCSAFKRHSAGIGCGLRINEKITAGIQADFFAERPAGSHNGRELLALEAGIAIFPSEKLTLAFHLFNPLPNEVRKYFLPTVLTAGAGCYLSPELFTGAEIEMSVNGVLILKTGFEYNTGKKIFLRGGFSTENNSFSFGFGYNLNPLSLDLSFAAHQQLGITSSVSISFRLNKG